MIRAAHGVGSESEGVRYIIEESQIDSGTIPSVVIAGRTQWLDDLKALVCTKVVQVVSKEVRRLVSTDVM